MTDTPTPTPPDAVAIVHASRAALAADLTRLITLGRQAAEATRHISAQIQTTRDQIATYDALLAVFELNKPAARKPRSTTKKATAT